MEKEKKAMVLSALVFPGSGQLFLKRYVLGALLISIALVATYFLISGMITVALDVADNIRRGIISPDIFAISDVLLQQLAEEKINNTGIAANILIVVWLVGIVDSFSSLKSQKNT